jgi:hypothetical protein
MRIQIALVVVTASIAVTSVAYSQTGLRSDYRTMENDGGQTVTADFMQPALLEPAGQDSQHIVKTGTNAITPVGYAIAPNWRYRFHNGEWWYWTPGNYWMYYRGSRWVPYDAVIYRRPVIVNRGPYYYRGGPYYYRDGYRYGYWGPGYSYYRPGYRYWDGYRYRPGYSYYRGPGYGYGPYRYGYGRYGYNPYYSRDPGVRAGANIGGAIGGRGGADVGARIGAGIGRTRW